MALGVKSHHQKANAGIERWPIEEGYLVPRKKSNQGHPVIVKFSPTCAKIHFLHTPWPRLPNNQLGTATRWTLWWVMLMTRMGCLHF